jgi:hypothetical protein
VSIARDWPSTGADDPLHKRSHQKALRRVRELCLTMPDASEKMMRGHIPTITVGGKNFCIFWRADGRPNVCFNAGFDAQETLVAMDPSRYFVPAYMGVRGWVGARLDGEVDWETVEQLALDAHRHAAPAPKASRRKR